MERCALSITVLMSTFNGEKYLREQLDSIRKQTIYSDLKIIVRDDGSTDSTLEILKEYANDGHLQYYCGENIGSAQSFHELLRNVEEDEFYAFADQDDVWLPRKLENAIDCIKNYKKPIVYASAKKIVDADLFSIPIKDVVPPKGYINTMLKANVVSGCTMVFNNLLRKEYLKCKKINRNIYHDSYIWKLGDTVGEIYFDHKAQILYRQHGNNTVGAMPFGYELFRIRVKKFIYSNKYRENKRLSSLAKMWTIAYKNNVKRDKYKVLMELGMVQYSFFARIKLFFERGLDLFPLYEYIGIKVRILLGWI